MPRIGEVERRDASDAFGVDGRHALRRGSLALRLNSGRERGERMSGLVFGRGTAGMVFDFAVLRAKIHGDSGNICSGDD